MNRVEVTEKVRSSVQGKVLGSKMDKTVTVLVERKIKHPVYGKYIVRSTKVHAHDEHNEYKEGDVVNITQTRPLSKTKFWRVVNKVEC